MQYLFKKIHGRPVDYTQKEFHKINSDFLNRSRFSVGIDYSKPVHTFVCHFQYS